MTADLRPCCQRVLLDHYAVCEARRDTKSPAPSSGVRQCQACPHSEVLHSIRGNGSRGSCSMSAGPAAEPCGCKAFSPAETGALSEIDPPEPKRGGHHL